MLGTPARMCSVSRPPHANVSESSLPHTFHDLVAHPEKVSWVGDVGWDDKDAVGAETERDTLGLGGLEGLGTASD